VLWKEFLCSIHDQFIILWKDYNSKALVLEGHTAVLDALLLLESISSVDLMIRPSGSGMSMDNAY